MRRLATLSLSLLLGAALAVGCDRGSAPPPAADRQREVPAAREPEPLLHTYSIVARDPESGQLGVAVQSHWFHVGRMVPWAEPGVGAVATQALTNPALGPEGLRLLRGGKSPEQALKIMLERDAGREQRQVALIDARGRVAAWTGDRCLAAAGHHTGKGYAVQANLMASPRVWPAMARAYEKSRGSLARRLLAALVAAERAGGDLRGAQSAALLVVAPKPTGRPWKDRIVDIRVADDAQPLKELARLLTLHEAYAASAAGDAALGAGALEPALRRFARARKLAPEVTEIQFWQAVSLYKAGQRERALPIFRRLIRPGSPWATLLDRLPAGDVLTLEQTRAIRAATRR